MSRPLPRDVCQAVADLAWEIVYATLRDDRAAERRSYRRLEAYAEAQAKRGKSHPFVLETLADFTNNDRKATEIYRRALRLSNRVAEPKHSILLALGRRNLEPGGNRSLAARYLKSSRAEAKRRRDSDIAAEATKLLAELRRDAT